jgi:hypothetical protein
VGGCKLVGTIWSGAFLDLICGLLRVKENGSFNARVLQSAKEQSKGAKGLQANKEERGSTILGVHISRNQLQRLRGACKESGSFEFIFLVVLIA